MNHRRIGNDCDENSMVLYCFSWQDYLSITETAFLPARGISNRIGLIVSYTNKQEKQLTKRSNKPQRTKTHRLPQQTLKKSLLTAFRLLLTHREWLQGSVFE